ncbi:MAG: ABC transporter permease [Lentisphaeria bacterium]|nr:ABC transporter permease [Lentisphaeria bacterium]
MAESAYIHSIRKKFFSSRSAVSGVAGIIFLLIPAIFAPLIANGRPLLLIDGEGTWSMPFLRFFFAPESSEVWLEKIANFTALMLPAWLFYRLILRRKPVMRRVFTGATALICALLFILAEPVMDKRDYRQSAQRADFVIFAPVPYGPDEIAGTPYEPPSAKHLLGCDDVGRDLLSRLIYGARVSLAAGIFATLLALVIGVTVGMCTGFFKGKFDLFVMRIVEILLCFPTFLLLLILMSMMRDCKIGQSIPLLVAVIGCTAWISLAMLVRGEVLKESSLPYIQSCAVAGIPRWRIMFRHLLPNTVSCILISIPFMVAGAIMSESGLSFLGFGVQPPTASWGNLLRQAFDNPLSYWHLTFFPGLALFIAVLSFNFTGEGLRRAFDVKEV